MIRPIQRFFRNLRHVRDWLPILWNDYDWDWTQFFVVMEFKLRRMEKDIRRGCHVNCERDADQILEAAILCKRMSREDYYPWPDPKFMPHLKQWQLSSGKFNGCNYDDYMFDQDLKRFNLILQKYVRHWWE